MGFKEFPQGIRNEFTALVLDLEPENLFMDGELCPEMVSDKRDSILDKWQMLEAIVGRAVTETEVWNMI